MRAAARVVTFTSTGARATRSARAARLVAGAVWRHSWSRQPRATLQPRAAHAGAREGGSQQSAEACAWCSRLPSLLLLRVGGVDSACTLPSIATAVSWGPGHGAAATKGARSIRILVKSRPFRFSAWHGHAQTRQRAGSAACGRRRVATIVLSSAKGHAAAESGERACAAAHVAAGGGQPLSTGAARLASRVFGSALAPVCNRVHSGADESTTLAHLCATRGSWRWTRVAAGTLWSQCIPAHGVASGHVVLQGVRGNQRLSRREKDACT